MMSSRQQLSPGTAGTMPPIPGDADFGSGCYTTHHPYAAFDATVQHHQQQLYDSTTGLDYAAAFSAFVPQQADNPAPASAHLFPSLPPSFTTNNNNATMLLQPAMLTPHPGLLPASSPMPSDNNAYLQLQQQQQQHPFGGFQLKRENEGGLIFPFSSDAMAAAGSIGGSGSGGGRIGLNLGRRTYFSPADVLAVDRLLMRTRGGLGGGQGAMGVLGLGLGGGGIIGHQMQQPPRCQAEGCKADLSAAKHYHRRHKVCEYHAKAAAVAANGKQQRFCQQCSRFHVLAEFDEAKRSCRKRLTEHNRRRRKPVGVQGKDSPPPPPSKKLEACITTSSYAGDHTNTNKSTAAVLSPSASAFSCLQQQEDQELDDNDEGGGGGRPTTLSLAAPPPQRDYGGALDTMLLMHHHRHHHHHQAAAAVVQEDDHEQAFMMTSLVQSHQQHGDDGNGNILSCSPTSTSDQRRQQHHQMQINDGGDDSGCCNNSGMQQQQQQHFFEVDFM